MPRPILDETHIHPSIRSKVATHQQAMVQEVIGAIRGNDVVGAYAAGHDGLYLNPLKAEQDAAARDAARDLFEEIQRAAAPTHRRYSLSCKNVSRFSHTSRT